jgi:hypothetical protein
MDRCQMYNGECNGLLPQPSHDGEQNHEHITNSLTDLRTRFEEAHKSAEHVMVVKDILNPRRRLHSMPEPFDTDSLQAFPPRPASIS